MTTAYIYDAVRTPRGRGRSDGALHEITALSLAAQALQAIRDRNGLDTALVDDVIMGCVMPVGEQGSDIARIAALVAGYDEKVPGVQINRFCASGLEACNIAAAKVASGEARFAIGGGVESMSRVALAADGGAMMVDPTFAFDHSYAPQGIGADMVATIYGFSRADVDTYAVESQRRAALAWAEGRFVKSVVPVFDQAGVIILDHDEHMRPQTDMQSLAKLEPAFTKMGEAGYDAAARARYPQMGPINHVHHGGNSSGIAMGHPLGATGGMILGTALDELERTDRETALINLCVGAGMGTAIAIARL